MSLFPFHYFLSRILSPLLLLWLLLFDELVGFQQCANVINSLIVGNGQQVIEQSINMIALQIQFPCFLLHHFQLLIISLYHTQHLGDQLFVHDIVLHGIVDPLDDVDGGVVELLDYLLHLLLRIVLLVDLSEEFDQLDDVVPPSLSLAL